MHVCVNYVMLVAFHANKSVLQAERASLQSQSSLAENAGVNDRKILATNHEHTGRAHSLALCSDQFSSVPNLRLVPAR